MHGEIASKMHKSAVFLSNEDQPVPEDIIDGELFRLPENLTFDPKAVFVEFSGAAALEKLLKIKEISPAERLSYTRHLAELIVSLGNEGVANLKEILGNLVQENDEVKMSLLEEMPGLSSFLGKREHGYQEIIEILLPTLVELLSDGNLEIKEKAGAEVSKLSSLLSEEDRGKYILTSVLGMAHNDCNENDRIVAVQLLSKMSTFFGKDLCEQFVGLELLSLGEDPQTKVRRETIIHLPTIAKIVSPIFFKQRFFPFFLSLANDTSWTVRKACVEILVEISEMCEKKVKETTLSALLLKFCKDANKWVKHASFLQLGPFIHSLRDCEISEQLLANYCEMASENDQELSFACAYNFPAVLQAFGAQQWPVLFNIFQALLNKDAEIRQPLACSLHEVAKIIGPEHSFKDLSFVFETFLTDSSISPGFSLKFPGFLGVDEELKYGVIKNLSKFLEVVGEPQRQGFLEIFPQLQDSKKWRIRQNLATQIHSLSSFFSKEIAYKIFVPIALKLCEDAVASVRAKAAKTTAKLLIFFAKTEEFDYFQAFKNSVKKFSASPRFNVRQTFAIIVAGLLKELGLVKSHFLKEITALVFDKCVNVRIIVARLLVKNARKQQALLCEDFVKELLNVLSFDKSNEVIDAVKQLIFLEKVEKMEKMELEDESFVEESKENPCVFLTNPKISQANHVKIGN